MIKNYLRQNRTVFAALIFTASVALFGVRTEEIHLHVRVIAATVTVLISASLFFELGKRLYPPTFEEFVTHPEKKYRWRHLASISLQVTATTLWLALLTLVVLARRRHDHGRGRAVDPRGVERAPIRRWK